MEEVSVNLLTPLSEPSKSPSIIVSYQTTKDLGVGIPQTNPGGLGMSIKIVWIVLP